MHVLIGMFILTGLFVAAIFLPLFYDALVSIWKDRHSSNLIKIVATVSLLSIWTAGGALIYGIFQRNEIAIGIFVAISIIHGIIAIKDSSIDNLRP